MSRRDSTSGRSGNEPKSSVSLPTVAPSNAAAGTGTSARHGARAEVVQTVWARLLMSSLKRAGIERVVISPGSRSTPFTLAAEHAGMLTQTVIDERSAGFLALGCARALARPVLLICTSGSAGAHYFPAIIEAAYAHVPLVVLTADRPPELMACAAPQTIDQTRLFGDHVRFFTDLGTPEASTSCLRALVRKSVQAVHHALAPCPGPVHLNAPARKPLEPTEARSATEIALVERAEAVLLGFHPQVVAGRARAPDATIRSLAQACGAARRGVIVAGPAHPRPASESARLYHAVCELAVRAGFPVLVESASQLRLVGAAPADTDDPGHAPAVIDNVDLILAQDTARAALAPDLIVQIGAPPTSRHWADFASENRDCVYAVLAEHGWNDPLASADLMILADPGDTVERVVQEMRRGAGLPEVTTGWLDSWIKASDLAWEAVTRVLAGRESDAPETLPEGAAMAAAVAAAPRGAWLLLGNSLPIRTVDVYTRHTHAGVHVIAQRGANGIDGFVSAAAGTAWATLGPRAVMGATRPTLAIIGDVCFVHDLGGLAAASRARAPLCIMVIDNRGGRIFDRLPIAALDRGDSSRLYRDHFLTEPGCDIRAAAATFGARYQSVTSADALRDAVTQACTQPGCTIVRAVVAPESATRDRMRIDSEFRRLLESGWQPGPAESEVTR